MTKIKTDPTEVRFYRASEKPYGAFSNLYRREIEFEDEKFTTSEHAYQAGKARKPAVRKWLMEAPSPALLAMAAHGLYVWDINSDWSKIKFDRMKRVLQAKFTQHEDLKELLLSTGTARLVESATVDNAVNRLWGEVNGVGKNKLGELLMEVRAELVAAAAPVRTKRKAEPKAPTKSRAAKATVADSAAPRSKRRAAAEAVSA
ncbi:NADAR family protein [Roseateles sp.]|uniref:NADAR family protein n=1 Tax=Roseateles sp. TaxID=1971397 RepID=UPI003D126CEF